MKKSIFFVFIMIISLSASTVFAANNDPKTTTPGKAENKLSEDELVRLTKRVEEIRDMDMKELTGKQKAELRKELKGLKETYRRDGGVVYISAGTLILILILVIILL